MGQLSELRAIGPGDAEYPRLLRDIHTFPRRLHACGRSLDQAPFIAVVGSRKASGYGFEVAAWIAAGLSRAGLVVVSGMARGIDAAAHRGALDAGFTTVAVLGSGLDVCYPRANAGLYREIIDYGTLLSEYPEGTRPKPQHFPTRNRIIAGMSLGVVVVEAREGGGAMITARLAMEYGREVFCVSGPVHSPGSLGPLALVRDGARLVGSAADVLEDLGFQTPQAPTGAAMGPAAAALGPDEAAVLGGLEPTPVPLDTVARRVRMPASSAAAVLSQLELKGLASRHRGGRFARSVAGAHPELPFGPPE